MPTTAIPTYDNFLLGAQPGAGSNAYGYQVGQVGAPPSIWEQLSQNLPGFSDLTSTGTSGIMDELKGVLSPSTTMNLANTAASRGVQLGQPNSPLSSMINLNLLGTTSENLKSKGLSDLNSFLSTTGQMQQSPQLLSQIAEQNAINAAAPNPEEAAQQQIATYRQMMQEMMSQANPASGAPSFYQPATPSGGGNYSQFPMFNPNMSGDGSNYWNNVMQDLSSRGSGIGPVITTGGGGGSGLYGGLVNYGGDY